MQDQLKQISDLRVTGWKDTLAAKRKARLEWKADKDRQEEEQRKLQDAKEAALQKRVRNEILQNADKLIWEKTEKVRQFRSQQMLVDTLTARDSQIKEKEEKRKKDSEEEKKWHLAKTKCIQEAEQKSMHDLHNEKQKARDFAEDLKRQRDEAEEQRRIHHQHKRQEEELIIKKMAADDLAAERVSNHS